jgi:isoquinoline 1-oxidoreductase alpha subunit
LNGGAIRSCITPLRAVEGQQITTIEGLAANADHPLQQAWIAEQVPQCGYCQSGQIMQAAALLRHTPDPSDEEIVTAMDGNLCRCGTYQRIKRAIKRAAGSL